MHISIKMEGLRTHPLSSLGPPAIGVEKRPAGFHVHTGLNAEVWEDKPEVGDCVVIPSCGKLFEY